MLEQFERIWDRYEELTIAISQPEVIADTARYQQALKERSLIEPQAMAYQQHQSFVHQLSEAQEMLQDAELADMAQVEINQLTAELTALQKEMQLLLLPKDPDDEKSVVLEVRAGAGGEEAALFAADLVRMYDHYAADHGFSVSYVSISETELSGMKEAVLTLNGKGAFARFKYESGVHRVQRIPITDTTGKKQTSTCTVAVLPEAEDIDYSIDPKDIRVDTYRATGHGGQYINTTDSAVRLTHLPTGLVVTSQDQKSQLKNKEQALKVLRSRLLELRRESADAAYSEKRRVQVGTGDRSERIRTYNFHEGRVTDHRIGLTLFRINDIMNGDLDEIIDALRGAEQALLLQGITTE